MSVPKATVARRSYNRALKDLDRDLDIAREAAREAASLLGLLDDVRFVVWIRGFDFAKNRARRLLK